MQAKKAKKEGAAQFQTAFANLKAAAASRLKAGAVAAKWMLAMAACALAFNVADNYYFRDAVAATSEYGFQQGWAECTRLHTALRMATSDAEKVQAREALKECPSWHYELPHRDSFRTTLLNEACEVTKAEEAKLLQSLGNEAVTWVSDGWRDAMYGNAEQFNCFMLTSKGPIFGQCTPTNDNSKTGQFIASTISAGIKHWRQRGVNVKFVCTDGASACVSAQRLLEAEYEDLFAYTCAAHGADLLIEDVVKDNGWLKDLLDNTNECIKYITAHDKTNAWFRAMDGAMALLRPSTTRFAYSYITLERFSDDRTYVRALFGKTEHTSWIGNRGVGGGFKYTDLYDRLNNFVTARGTWATLQKAVILLRPLWLLVRALDTNLPIMTKVAMLYMATLSTYKNFNKDEIDPDLTQEEIDSILEPIIARIERRSDYVLKPVHKAAAFFNPEFHVKLGNPPPMEWQGHLEDVFLRHYNNDASKAAQAAAEFAQYWKGEGVNAKGEAWRFSEIAWMNAQPDRKTDPNNNTPPMDPISWMNLYVRPRLPMFADVAIAFLGAHATTSQGERLHKTYGLIHTKLRNALLRVRAIKLVHLHMWLRLKKVLSDVASSLPVLDWFSARTKETLRKEAEEISAQREAEGEPPMQPGGYLEMLLVP